MSDEGEIWKEHKQESQRKRWENRDKSIALLKEKGIEVRMIDEGTGHYKIGSWNFWPTTGKFYNEKTKVKGRGVFNLIKHL